MASKYVSETKAGQSVSAYVILKNGKDIATVRAHFSDGGSVLVNVFNYGATNSDHESKPFQHARAGGYGYDKFTAALSGMTIDGITMCNHSNRADSEYKCDKTGKPRGKKLPPDVSGANWRRFDGKGWHEDGDKSGDFTSWYIEPGLRRLEKRGYTVIQAI